MRSLAAWVFCASAACSQTTAPPPAAGSGSAAAPVVVAKRVTPPVAVDAAVAVAVDAAGSGAGSAAIAPITAAQKAAGQAYRAAMARGRKATDAKAYPDAIAAFDDAIKAKPNDARAYAERGFAKLLAGTDLASASADFDHAADGTTDPKLLGMIWFNRGLVDDKLGDADTALIDYYLANQNLPTKTAAAKLAGKTICPVRVTLPPAGAPPAAIDAAGWLALLKAFDATGDMGSPTSDAEAKKAVFADGAATLPAAIIVGGYSGKTAYVVAQRAGKLRAFPLAREMGGRCSGSVGGAIVGTLGNLMLLRADEETGGDMDELCGDDHHTCTGADTEERTGTACGDTGTTVRDLVVDLASGRVLVVAEQPMPAHLQLKDDDARLAQAALGPDGLHLTGLGCDRVVPLAPAK